MTVNETWYNAVCQYGNFPRTEWTRQFFDEWARWEGVPERICNPLATTEPAPDLRSSEDIGFGPGRWNDANPPYGVGIYKSQAAGGEATARTLRNGYYPALVRALEQQDVIDPNAVAANIRTWGTMGFAQRIADRWEPSGSVVKPPAPAPVIGGMSEADVRRIIDEVLPVYFRKLMAAYWTHVPGDYSDANGNPIPPDPAVVEAVSKEMLTWWWGRVG